MDKIYVLIATNINLTRMVPYVSAVHRHHRLNTQQVFNMMFTSRTQTFKSGKTVIHFHIPNEIYDAMVKKRETNGKSPENLKNSERKTVRKVTVRVEQSMAPAADFTVSILFAYDASK